MRHAGLAIAAVAALTGAALGFTGCNSDKLAGCSFAAVDYGLNNTVAVAQGDSIRVYAATVADCPQIGRAVNFTIANPSLATVHAFSDTTAMLIGKAQGDTKLYLTPRDYPQNRDSIWVTIIGPNP